MKICLLLVVFILTGCASIRNYEDIVEDVLEDYQSSSITHHVSFWVPIHKVEDSKSSDELAVNSNKDKELCIDDNRNIKFKDEAFSIVIFMQCMNEKGWRLETEDLIIFSH